MHVVVRARSADLPLLRNLERAAGELFRGVGMDSVADDEPPALAVLAGYQRDGRAWVSLDNRDRPTAYLLLDEVDGAAHIEQLSVDPRFARRGLGARLIDEAAEAWASEHDLPALTLMTFRDVPWNRPYYERLGFRTLDTAELTPGLLALRAREAELGLTRWPRVAMRRVSRRGRR